jgi:hypothetical protein
MDGDGHTRCIRSRHHQKGVCGRWCSRTRCSLGTIVSPFISVTPILAIIIIIIFVASSSLGTIVSTFISVTRILAITIIIIFVVSSSLGTIVSTFISVTPILAIIIIIVVVSSSLGTIVRRVIVIPITFSNPSQSESNSIS